MKVRILGIRHHGPGSAKNVVNALEEIQPDIVLIEGPPEGEEMISWVNHTDMKPPVALLAYVPDQPQQAVFYPFTSYSPEWNAINYGLKNNIPVRFMDMPLAHKLVKSEKEELVLEGEEQIEETPEVPEIRQNPLQHLAELAGFEDQEEWWEHQFELTEQSTTIFDAIADSMTALREAFPKEDKEEQLREAFMRRILRKAIKDKYENIVVVCGAWHVPALENMPTQKHDNDLLKNLPKTAVNTTWIPWTNSRLSNESGYGAGVNSPGWYQHLWDNPTDNGVHWLSLTANVFREQKMDMSSAHIIEAVRLSNALADLRNFHRPSLKEHLESTQTVMCMGDGVLLDLVWKELIVGKAFGEIPEGAPQSPIQRDFEKKIKTFRLKISEEYKTVTLDLRETPQLNKSIFLHRLRVLGIDWARLSYASSKGTFKEEWELCWKPENTIQLLEKASWGNSVEMATNRYLQDKANSCTDLVEISRLVEKALPAELHEGIQAVMHQMDVLAAASTDTFVLMQTFTPLVQIVRYGNVRNTDTELVNFILQSVFYRILSGLLFSTTNINEDEAAKMVERIREVHDAVLLLENETYKEDWLTLLQKVLASDNTEPIIHGACCKILYAQKQISSEETAITFYKALSIHDNPTYSGNWLEGFLTDGATVLLFDDEIWEIMNEWLGSLPDELFIQIIPLLRRTFSSYTNPEKRKIAQKANQTQTSSTHFQEVTDENLNTERAEKVLPIIEKFFQFPN